jgi:DEAD/DEAH box helicase domain-containing protein
MDLVERLSREEFGFKAHPKYEERGVICASFFALVAQAREKRSGQAFPLVPTQVQLWIRELRRLGRLADDTPVFTWLDEPAREFPSLPTYHCSECGESGWIALHDVGKDAAIGACGVDGFQLESDPSKIYRGWFGYKGARNPHLVVLSPLTSAEIKAAKARQEQFGFEDLYLCPKSLVVRRGDGPCPLTHDPRRFRVKVNRAKRKDEKRGVAVGDQRCANCGSAEGVFFIGSQAATLVQRGHR